MGGSTTGNYALYGAVIAAAVVATVLTAGLASPAAFGAATATGAVLTAGAAGATTGLAVGATKQYAIDEPKERKKESARENAIFAEQARVAANNERAKNMYFRDSKPGNPTQISDILAGRNMDTAQQPSIKNAPVVKDASVMAFQQTTPSKVGA